MARYGIAPGPVGARRKIATAFAAAGALLLSSGMVGLAAPAASAAADKDKSGKAVGNDNSNKGKGNSNAGGNQGGSNAGGNQGGNNAGEKYYVCKWVGQPEDGDAAHHIISVPGSPLQGEGFFNDKQGPSYVLVPEAGEEPSLGDCPAFTDPGGNDDEVLAVLGLDVVKVAGCGTYGSIEAPISAADNVSYSITPGPFGAGLSGDHTVTATLDDAADDFAAVSSPWEPAGDRKAQQVVQLGSFEACSDDDDDDDIDGGNGDGDGDGGDDNGSTTKTVSPRYASTTDATCSRNGRLVVPNQPKGVQVQRTGSVPGSVTFTYSPADGYRFPKGTDRKVTLQVEAQLTGVDCIRGVETVKPNPQPGSGPGSGPAVAPVNAGNDAEVLGEQAVAVPTAVAAGLGDTMTAATTTASPQLAQALVAAGLLMLVMGGATGLGRRTRGAHES